MNKIKETFRESFQKHHKRAHSVLTINPGPQANDLSIEGNNYDIIGTERDDDPEITNQLEINTNRSKPGLTTEALDTQKTEPADIDLDDENPALEPLESKRRRTQVEGNKSASLLRNTSLEREKPSVQSFSNFGQRGASAHTSIMKSPGAAKAWKKAKITLNAVKFKSG